MAAQPLRVSSSGTGDPPTEQLAELFSRWRDVRQTRDLMRAVGLEMQLVPRIEEAADSAISQMQENSNNCARSRLRGVHLGANSFATLSMQAWQSSHRNSSTATPL